MEYKGIVFDRYVLKSPEIDANGYVVVDLLDNEGNILYNNVCMRAECLK